MKLSISQCPTSPSKMEDVSRAPYQSAFGSLMYAMVCTSLDIAQAMGVLSCYMSNPGRVHWDVVKRIFKYLWGTTEYSIYFQGTGDWQSLSIRGFVDSNWTSDVDRKKSTSAYVFTLNGGVIS